MLVRSELLGKSWNLSAERLQEEAEKVHRAKVIGVRNTLSRVPRTFHIQLQQLLTKRQPQSLKIVFYIARVLDDGTPVIGSTYSGQFCSYCGKQYGEHPLYLGTTKILNICGYPR